MDLFKKTPKIFSLEIEKLASEKRMTHLDAILYYCDKNSLEVESVKKLITKGLKDKIEVNARELNLLISDNNVGVGKLPV
jgi:hypothetical protein|tara:strand:+ start:1525 stop:1764 length:240 start_codon:yes stop_codon:yes gene_type:complete